MAIKYLPTLGDTPRDFQQAMTEVGRIRIGRFNPDKGKSGAPDKLDRFRFTSDDQARITALAARYGGVPTEYTPQRSNRTAWEVISEASSIEVLLPPQTIEPWNEAWKPGLCVRRCDGEWEIKEAETKGLDRQPCPCNLGRVGARDLCKPTIRVKVMLPHVPPGLATWRLESHGEYACSELSMLGPIVARLQALAPATLTLRKEQRRRWNAEKGRYDTLDFFVPTMLLDSATPMQFAIGGEELVRALTARGGIALDNRPRPALESAPPTPAEQQQMALENQMHASMVADGAAAGEIDTGLAAIAAKQGIAVDEVRTRILRDIEAAYTLDALMEIKNKLTSRGVGDQRVRDAWNGRKNAVKAAAEVGGSAPGPADQQANADHQRALRAQQERIAESHAMNDAAIASVRTAKREAQAHVRQVLDGEPTPDEMSGPVDPNHGDPPPDWAVPEYAAGPDVDTSPVLTLDNQWAVLFATVPNWPTGEVHERIKTFCGVEKSSQATAEQLHALTAAIRRGEVR